MAVLAPFSYVVLESVVPRVAWSVQLVADDAVIRFDDDGEVVPPGPDGTVGQIAVGVPRLPGMTALVVERASLAVLGRRREQLPVPVAASSSSASRTLQGPGGGSLARLEIRGLKVTAPGDGMALRASSGTPSGYRWALVDGEVVRSGSVGSGDLHLHLLVRADGPPLAAVPHYAMPDNSAGLYGPVLAGASLRVDHPTAGTATVTFDPPLPATSVTVVLVTNDTTQPHQGLPHEARTVPWTAQSVTGVWAAAPTDVTLEARAGSAGPVRVAQMPGALADAEIDVDVTPAARSLLTDAYAADDDADLELAVTATSTTAGELAARRVTLTAHYRFDSVDAQGLDVSLRGRPATVALPLPEGLEPQQMTLTVDGRFGPGVLVGSSDGERPGRRTGVRLTGDVRAARRLALTDAERLRPLLRVTVLAAADSAAELLVEVAADRNGRVGPLVAGPVAIAVDPSDGLGWWSADLPPVPAAAGAVWLVVRATTGTVRWYAETGPSDAGPSDPAQALVSVDAGGTWAASTERGCAQLHVLAERPEPAPLALHWPGGLLADDVLTLPATRTRIETTGADAVQRDPGAETLAATPLETPVGRSVTFRKEGLTPLPVAALATVATLGSELPLTLSSARDCDLRVLDATLRYHPEEAR